MEGCQSEAKTPELALLALINRAVRQPGGKRTAAMRRVCKDQKLSRQTVSAHTDDTQKYSVVCSISQMAKILVCPVVVAVGIINTYSVVKCV